MTDRPPSPPHRFNLGALLSTPGALRALEASGQTPFEFLRQHLRGDWGEVCADDAAANDRATAAEEDPDARERVLSVYHTKLGVRLWIITEADRSATTILLPGEY